MKSKLIQILLGAIGSAVTVMITYLAEVPADVSTGLVASSGPATTLLSSMFNARV